VRTSRTQTRDHPLLIGIINEGRCLNRVFPFLVDTRCVRKTRPPARLPSFLPPVCSEVLISSPQFWDSGSNGRRTPKVNTARKIAKAIGMPFESFLDKLEKHTCTGRPYAHNQKPLKSESLPKASSYCKYPRFPQTIYLFSCILLLTGKFHIC